MDLGHRGSHDRRHSEFLAFLKQVAGAYPRRRLQVICDNYATDKQPVVQGWLAKHPRVMLHFTATSASWLNLVEVFFSIVDRQALRRHDFPVSTTSPPPSGGRPSRVAGPAGLLLHRPLERTQFPGFPVGTSGVNYFDVNRGLVPLA
jgi:hypothetical protein